MSGKADGQLLPHQHTSDAPLTARFSSRQLDVRRFSLILTCVAICASLVLCQLKLAQDSAIIFSALLTIFLAAMNCLYLGSHESSEARMIWILVAASLVPWIAAHFEILLLGSRIDLATLNFLLFIQVIPAIFALSTANEDVALRSFLWPDVAIAAILVAVEYQNASSTGSYSGVSGAPSLAALNKSSCIGNLILGFGFMSRLFLSSSHEIRRMCFILSTFFWTGGLNCWIATSTSFGRQLSVGNQDLFVAGVPTVILIVMLTFWPKSLGQTQSKPRTASVSAFAVDNLSPFLLIIEIAIGVLQIGKQQVRFQIISLTSAMILFGARTVMRQSAYVRGYLQIVQDQQALLEMNAQLSRDATRDGLTGAYNRRYFDQMLGEEWKRAARARHHISLILVDVDHFKSLNDLYGHTTGDAVLRAIVRTLTTVLRRPSDLLARYGGEEFAIILPGVDSGGALLVAEHVRAAVERRQIPNDQPGSGRVVTVSIGVGSDQPTIGSNSQEFLDRIDAALYVAKSQGRNRVCS